MNLQHINIKIYVDGELPVDRRKFIEVFHEWTAGQSMPEMMIDVADYRHVPQGPGVVMVGLEADYALDDQGGGTGLRYNCKAARDARNEALVRQAFERVCTACARLEQEVSGLRFCRDRFAFWINDRALAPHNAQSLAEAKREWPEIFERMLGGSVQLTFEEDPRKLFGATVVPSRPFGLG